MPETHHINSPSRLYRRYHCPGSVHLEKDRPDPGGEYAEKGHLLHKAVWLPKEEWPGLSDLTSSDIQTLEIATGCLEKLNVSEWHVETPLKLVGKFFEIATEGTPDGWGVNADGIIELVDFKFGWIEVSEPAENLQLAAYACMLKQAHPEVEMIRAHIIQPNLAPVLRSYTFRRFERLEQRIFDIIAQADKAEPDDLQPGDWCRYCRASTCCPAIQKLSTSLQERTEMGLVEVTPENAYALEQKRKIVQKALDTLKDEIKQVVQENGGEVGEPGAGLKFKTTKGSRYISDVQAAYHTVQSLYTVEEFLRFCSMDFTRFHQDCVNRLVENGKVKTKKQAESALDHALPIMYGKGREMLQEWKQKE